MKTSKCRLQTQIEMKDKDIVEKKLESYGLTINQAVSIFVARLKHDDSVMQKLFFPYKLSQDNYGYISDSYANYLDDAEKEAENLDKRGKLKSYKTARQMIKDLDK